MDVMIALGLCTVHAAWKPDGTLFFWATRGQSGTVDAVELKYMLFAWHTPSFYGTFIDTAEFGPREGIALSSEEALDYFCDTAELQHARVEWDAETAALKAAAPAIRKALAGGSMMPDYNKWRQGAIGWKLALPGNSPLTESPLLRTWTDSLVEAEVRKRPELKEALARLEEVYPRLARGDVSADLWLDEDDWLVSIGWKPDSSPFRTCLQLAEPEDAGAWTLKVVLQDRQRPDVLVACDEQGHVLEDEALPETWQPELDRVSRDIERWLHILPWLRDNEAPERMRRYLNQDEAWEFLAHGSLQLAESGSAVFLPAWWDRVRKAKPRLRAKIKSSVGTSAQTMFGLNQLIDFDWRLAVGDIELTEEEFRRLIEEKRKLIRFRGQWIQLDPDQLEAIQRTMKQVRRKKGLSLRDVLEAHLLSEDGLVDGDFSDSGLEVQQFEVELNDHLLRLITQLKSHSADTALTESPKDFHGTLRPYQTEGVSWLLFLRKIGFGGCLADDMGLGKTIQWITYLLALKDEASRRQDALSTEAPAGERQPAAPSLLICPTSVLGNWQKELQRFAPSLRVHLHYGPQRLKGEAFTEAVRNTDIVLSSYMLVHLDQNEFQSVDWDSICLDEAQNIKNAYTKQSGAVRKLRGFHRIAMTGTPIENRLTELWSIFDFLNPGYLGSLREFGQNFVQPIERTKDPARIAQVQRLIRPFLLRRMKKDPAIQLDLPEKNEAKVFVSLTAEQASLYENCIQDMFDRLDRLSSMERRGLILSVLTRLKQICNHPALFLKEQDRGNWRDRSSKIERLLDMVSEVRQEGDRCLIFTQFVETGHLLQSILQRELGETVPFLYGGTPKAERDEMVARFQDESLPDSERGSIFLLSLKAGGIGLNLTAANHVFHFDRWWNPAVENQATDRAFRIGQKRHVQVHKFVTLGTLEERIDDMIERKQGLSQEIVGGGEGWITELSTEELQELFVLRRDWISG